MNDVSDLWKEIVATGDFETETTLAIGDSNVSDGVPMNQLHYIKTVRRLFEGDTPSIGSCVAGEIEAKLFQPEGGIPRNGRLRVYVRVHPRGRPEYHSEWLRKGTFWVDHRKLKKLANGKTIITLTGYDAILRAEEEFDWSVLKKWPAVDINVVKKIAQQMGVSLDPRTEEIIVKGYEINLPDGYSCREILCGIAAMYGGNFVMSDLGQLLLVQLNNVPRESLVLLNEDGVPILFGGEPVLV